MTEPFGDCASPYKNGFEEAKVTGCAQQNHPIQLSPTKGKCAPKEFDSRALSAILSFRMGYRNWWWNQHETWQWNIYCSVWCPKRKNTGAGAVIHTHSKAAVMATLLYPGKEFKITHQEMIKGIKKCTTGGYFRYDDMLVVPIVENTPEEKDLKERMAHAMNTYPDTCAVLVRRHGVYVWGETWEKAKTMCECYDYLFDIAVQMKQHGIDPSVIPNGENGIV